MPHKSQLINHNMFESLEKLTAAVEAACADIAPSYAEYVQLAMAIATDCGEGGRADFHRHRHRLRPLEPHAAQGFRP